MVMKVGRSVKWISGLMFAVLALLVACKSEEAPPSDDDGTLQTKDDPNAKDATSDGAVLVPLDAGPGLGDVVVPSDACPGGQLACGAAGCVDTTKDPNHCGGCDKPCDSGTCSGGSCTQ